MRGFPVDPRPSQGLGIPPVIPTCRIPYPPPNQEWKPLHCPEPRAVEITIPGLIIWSLDVGDVVVVVVVLAPTTPPAWQSHAVGPFGGKKQLQEKKTVAIVCGKLKCILSTLFS
jgi:hypothetical protein